MVDLYNKVVLAVDGSDRSIEAARKGIYVAKNLGSKVLAVYVVEENIFDDVIPPDGAFEQWKSMLVDEGNKTLNKIVDIGKENDVSVVTLLLEGSPEVEIGEQIEKNDLVVIGDRGKNMLDRLLLGSTTEYFLHHSNSNVMVVK